MKRPLTIGIVSLNLAAVAAELWLSVPRRLDVRLDQPQTMYHARAGARPVTFVLTPEQGGDNGQVELRISSSVDEVVARSRFSYDTLQDQPAGSWRYAWVDGDAWPDVSIALNDGADAWVVLSADGRILSLRVK